MAEIYRFSAKDIINKTDIEGLLSNVYGLFGLLHPYIINNFDAIHAAVKSSPDNNKQYRSLDEGFYRCICKMNPQGLPGGGEAKKELLRLMSSTNQNDLCLLSLYTAVARFIGAKQIGQIKKMKVIEIGDLKLTPKPENPIYESIKAEDRVRRPEDIGVNIKKFTGVFQKIHVLERLHPQVTLRRMDDLVMNETNRLLKRGLSRGLRIAALPFYTRLEFEVESFKDKWPEGEQTPYLFKRIANPDSAEEALCSLLRRCHENAIDVLVLPELTIDDLLLGVLKDWLNKNNTEKIQSGAGGLIMVIAGSFHVHDGDAARNVATVLDYRGREIWTQAKCRAFTVSGGDVTSNPAIGDVLKIGGAGGRENILPGKGLVAVDMPIGRVCICICLDFIHPDNLEALRRSGINLFFVPAMSETNSRFVLTSETLGGGSLASSFVALTSFMPRNPEDIVKGNASFRYIPSRKNKHEFALNPNRELLFYEIKPGSGY